MVPDIDEPDAGGPKTGDLALARREVATLTGRLRCVEAERDAAVRERDRHHDLIRALRRSRSYRIGRVLVDLARDPVRNGPAIAARAARLVRRRLVRRRLIRYRLVRYRLVRYRLVRYNPVRRPSGPRRPVAASRRRAAPAAVPARVYVAVGLSRPGSYALVRALRQRIVVDADHVPVVVTDQPALRGLRVPGVVLEYLPDPQTWERHDPGADWEALLAGRIAHLCADYRAVAAVVVDPRDPPTLARLLAPVTEPGTVSLPAT